jgi:hypothetical protein
MPPAPNGTTIVTGRAGQASLARAATFFLACLAALELDGVALEEI